MTDFNMQVGEIQIVALTDMNLVYPTPLNELWPGVPPAEWERYRESFPDTFEGDAHMRIEIGCYLVRSCGKTILIDTGYGDGPFENLGGARGELMADLVSNKIDPAEVDTVFMSHLHVDHVGWNTREVDGKWVPTFPNARYLAHEADLAHFRKSEVRAKSSYPYMERYVEPLVKAGLFDTLGDEADLTPEVKAFLTPGHTPGHMSVLLASSGERAVIQGDVLIHPAQVTETEWTPLFDNDADVAISTRRRLLDEWESEGTPIISCHFPAPGLGRVVRFEGRRYWQVGP
ncbi:MAG: MBL fold metallo-hydrolase [Chloroflexi bacterium]|nr:MBL fold metallo-hydrolase [Chloroflexota bacterium]